MKTATNKDEAFDIESKPKGPHGWIQWKGTQVCMDVHCQCGAHFHVDGWFAYQVKCPACNIVYSCNGHIELIKLTNPDPKDCKPLTDEDYEN